MESPSPLLLLSCLAGGALALAYWAFAMFSDEGYPEDPEEIINSMPAPKTPNTPGSETGGLNPKNSTALFAPSIGILLLFFSLSSIAEALLDPDSLIAKTVILITALPALLALPCVIIGMTPISLPRWMYPEWQAARRALRRREQAQEQAAATDGYDPGTGTHLSPSERKRNRARAKDAIPWPPPSWTKARWWRA